MWPSANDTTTEVKTITILYADVAMAVSIPVYVAGCCAAMARVPC